MKLAVRYTKSFRAGVYTRSQPFLIKLPSTVKLCRDDCVRSAFVTAHKLRRELGCFRVSRRIIHRNISRDSSLKMDRPPREEAISRRAYFSARALITGAGSPKAANINRSVVIRFSRHKYLWPCYMPRRYATRGAR